MSKRHDAVQRQIDAALYPARLPKATDPPTWKPDSDGGSADWPKGTKASQAVTPKDQA
jgi:hypothetical protein